MSCCGAQQQSQSCDRIRSESYRIMAFSFVSTHVSYGQAQVKLVFAEANVLKFAEFPHFLRD